MPMLCLALSLLAQIPEDIVPTTPPPDQTFTSWVTRAPANGATYCLIAGDGDEGESWLSLVYDDKPCEIVWALDGKTPLSRDDLQPGVRITYEGPRCTSARRVQVHTLGPLAMSFAVEEFVAEASGDRLWTGLTPGECETVAALGSFSWFVREAVFRALREKGAAALRVLVWASRQRDGEIRERAKTLLRGLGWDG